MSRDYIIFATCSYVLDGYYVSKSRSERTERTTRTFTVLVTDAPNSKCAETMVYNEVLATRTKDEKPMVFIQSVVALGQSFNIQLGSGVSDRAVTNNVAWKLEYKRTQKPRWHRANVG